MKHENAQKISSEISPQFFTQFFAQSKKIVAAISLWGMSGVTFPCLLLWGYRTIIARYVAKWGIAQMCLRENKYQRGASHHFGGVLTSLKKYRAMWGIAAIVSQYRAIWGH